MSGEQVNIFKEYKAPEEIFQKIFNNYQIKNKKNMMFNPKALTSIYEELQKKGVYLTSFISEGNFGSVFEAKYNQEIVAVKCISRVDFKKIEDEEKILNLLKGTPYVFQTIKEFLNGDKSIYYQISKRYSCSLQEIMKHFFDQKKTLPLNQIIGFAIQMSTVFEQVQKKNLIHGDVKPENILYDSQDKSFYLCDFGESKQFKDGSKTYDLKGLTKKYASPEILVSVDGPFNVKYDIYSLGIILLELTRGEFLENKDCDSIREGNLKNYITKNALFYDLNKIINKMLETKFENRIDSFELTNQLNKLRQQLETQFVDLVQNKVDSSDSNQMISKFRQSFLQFNYTCKQNEIRLDEYSFEGEENIPNFKDCIANRLVHHLNLDFKKNGIGSDGAKEISGALRNCPNITQLTLNLSENKIGREGAISIASALENNQNINQLKLWLDENNIGDDGAKSIANVIRTYQNISSLDLNLRWNGIGSDGAKEISGALRNCPNITQLTLNLRYNSIDENGAKSISDALKNCKSMIQLELNLNYNKIGREGAISIASALENNQNFNQLKLWLYDNNIGDDGAKSIANVIRTYQNISLLALGLSENSISDDGAKNVANAIQNCQKITHLELYLFENKIGDDGAKSVANVILNCQQITVLKLSLPENKIGDDGAKSVANAILNCQQITELWLYLYSNQIGDSGAQSIVNAIQNCQKITSLELWLYENNISKGQKKLLIDSLRSKFGAINPTIKFDW